MYILKLISNCMSTIISPLTFIRYVCLSPIWIRWQLQYTNPRFWCLNTTDRNISPSQLRTNHRNKLILWIKFIIFKNENMVFTLNLISLKSCKKNLNKNLFFLLLNTTAKTRCVGLSFGGKAAAHTFPYLNT